MKGIPPVPPVGRVHPLIWSKAVRDDDDFIRNHLSGSIRLSLMTILAFAAGMAMFLLLLMLLD